MRIMGLDGGIASIGWAVVDVNEDGLSGRVVGAGTWMFNPPEEPGQGGLKLKSADRRTHRGARRVLRRRRQRMAAIRALLHGKQLLPSRSPDALRHPELDDPWSLRAAALDRRLEAKELAVVLGHIAKHRGFKSNAKQAAATNEAPDEKKKMLSASNTLRERLAHYRTVAEMLVKDKAFIADASLSSGRQVRRYRNREGDFSRSALRDDLADEVTRIFAAQRRHGSTIADTELETAYRDIAFFQRPLQGSEALLGHCPFETASRRTCRRAYSFELFRYLSRLNNLHLLRANGERRGLDPSERKAALEVFARTSKLTYAALGKAIGLSDDTRFEGLKAEDEGKLDVVARTGEAAAGTARLRKLIIGAHGEIAWHSLVATPDKLDRLAEIVAFRNDLGEIREGLAAIPLAPDLIDTIVDELETGKTFDVFTGAGHLSSKAVRAIIPGLKEGLTYDKACAAAGYDHTESQERHAFDVGIHGAEALRKILSGERITPALVGSPTARKAVIEMLKQVKAVIDRYGMPDRIHVELARDIGKSIDERGRIKRGIDRQNNERDKLRDDFAETLGRAPRPGTPGEAEMLKFTLWKEQQGRCLYSDTAISPTLLLAEDNSIQVDHILPWSRFGDNSYHNKTLSLTKANQEKRGRTPYEWFTSDRTPSDWDRFTAAVETIPSIKGMKRRNYLLRNAQEREAAFRSRNLNDTRWACRLLLEALRQVLPDEPDADGKLRRRVFARPGALTNLFRRAWGLQWVKRDDDGNRLPDDRHHALDAILTAVISESRLNRATREVQEIERKGLPYDLTKNISPPWDGFRRDVLDEVERVFVARAERRRARGKAHEATVRQVRERDGQPVVYERKAVATLTAADLKRIKDPERNAALLQSLGDWINAGRPADRPPRSPKGDIIHKVRLISRSKVNIEMYHGGPGGQPGTVDRGEMARVDVFRKANSQGRNQFFLVPVYPHQIATMAEPPNRAVTANKSEEDWPVIDESYEFLWSLVPLSYLRVTTGQGEEIEGYFRGFDRRNGAINLSPAHDHSPEQLRRGIGARTLLSFEKFTIDRFGQASRIDRETRTWRGKACT